MTQEDFFNSKDTRNLLKILIPFIVIYGAIVIFRGGYEFGKWLYVIQHQV